MKNFDQYAGLIEGVGHAKECINCKGTGYITVGSTTEEDNDTEVCGVCDGEGITSEQDDAAVDSYIEEQAFDNE